MSKDTHLRQPGVEVQAAIDKIIALSLATTTTPGLMSVEDKKKLDSIGIYYNTTDYWNNERSIPAEGAIIIYSDYKTIEKDGVMVNVPGFKIGSGNAFVQDLAFVDEAQAQDLLAHISDSVAHTTEEEKKFWNNKLNVQDEAEVFEDTLVLNRN